jgi:hypothetical protein
MKTWKEFKINGTYKENVGTADVAGFDAPFEVKKKKKKEYDGRTKQGRKFIERIIARRNKRLEEKED